MEIMTQTNSKRDTPERRIGQRAFSGVVWSMVDRGASQIIAFLATVLMARMLTPDDYGLIGLLLIFVEVGEALAAAGVTQALVAGGMKNPAEEKIALAINLAIGFVIYALLWMTAPLIADFYAEPQLIPLARMVGWCVPLRACCCLSEARLMHSLQYRRRAVAILCALTGAGIIGVSAAAAGSGVTAIALYMVAQSALTLICLSIAAGGISGADDSVQPSPRTKSSSVAQVDDHADQASQDSCARFSTTTGIIRRLSHYGLRLTVARLADVACNNSFLILIGRLFPVADVGLFTRARQFASVPSISMSEVVKRVSYPILCRYADMPRLQLRYSMRMSTLTMAVAMPAMLTLALLSAPIVDLVLGQKWMAVAPLMTWLCLGMMWTPLDGINLTLILASGRVGDIVKIELIRKIIPLIGLLATFRFGLTAICIGFALSGLLAMLATALYAFYPDWKSGRVAEDRLAEDKVAEDRVVDDKESPRKQRLLTSSKISVAALAAALFARFGIVAIPLSPAWLQLLVGLSMAIGSYLLLIRLFRIDELAEITRRLRFFFR